MANAINSLNYGNNIYTFTLPYGSCSTAAATAAKTVSVDNFSLETGARVAVKFTVTNTAGSPTLNVNSTGAKAIYYKGAAISAGYLAKNKVYEFIYNGTQWDLVGDVDTNTTYSFNGAVSTIKDSNLTASRALVSDGNGKVAVSAVTSTELGYLDGVTSSVQTQLNGKAASSHNHAASNITSGTLSSDRLPTVPVAKGGTGATTAAGALTNLGLTATATELNYMDGVTSNVQTQLNGKATSSHTHNYASSSSAGGSANSAVTLTTSELSSSATNTSGYWNPFTWTVTGAYGGVSGIYAIHDHENVFGGIFSVKCRVGKTADLLGSVEVKWLCTNSTTIPTLTLTYVTDSTNIKTVFRLYLSVIGQYKTYQISKISEKLSYTSVTTATAVVTSLTGTSKSTSNTTTVSNVAWSGVTSKPSYYDAKAIKGITRSGTTFTYTCMDGTTGTFTQQDNNTTYSAATTSAAGLMSASDKSKLDAITASADSVSFSRSLTSGTKVGTITINGTGTDLYAPTNTDTHYTTGLKVGASATATANAAASNGNVYLNVLDNTTVRDSHKIVGSGATTVTSDANGVITISSTDNNTTYGVVSTTANGLAPKRDGSTTKFLRGDGTWAVPPDTNTVYTHPTTSGNKHIPSGGSSGQILRWSADGTAVWGADNNTTYSAATQSAQGLMSAADKKKLDGIATGANAYSLPTASSSTLGGVKTTSTVTSTSGLTACPIISGVPYYKDTNTTYSLSSFGITSTAAELNYTDGVTSNIQTQLNGKLSTSGTAAKATADASGNTITSTYMKKANPTGTGYFSLNRKSGSTVGNYSVAIGSGTTASKNYSYAEGMDTVSSGEASHAEGAESIASGDYSHAENGAKASGSFSHAEGDNSTAEGKASHAEGTTTLASGSSSHAEGNDTEATGDRSHAEGNTTHATNSNAHAEGHTTTASGSTSHAEGYNTTASGGNSHSEGYKTTASGKNSHAEGSATTALDYQHAQGHHNNTSTAKAGVSEGTGTGTAFVIGNGTDSAASNAFRIDFNGKPYAKSTLTTSGADYAEYFEWLDGNPDNEDRRGYFVTLDGINIKKAEKDDNYILGVISGLPSVVGNGDEDWMGRYILDEFGAFIYEDFEYEVVVDTEEHVDEETGEVTFVEIKETRVGTKYKENPDYDKTKEYIQREDRPEWSAVGMIGVLSVRDDGTCKVNGYCKVTDGGIATASEKGYRVVKRVNDNIVKIVFR